MLRPWNLNNTSHVMYYFSIDKSYTFIFYIKNNFAQIRKFALLTKNKESKQIRFGFILLDRPIHYMKNKMGDLTFFFLKQTQSLKLASPESFTLFPMYLVGKLY